MGRFESKHNSMVLLAVLGDVLRAADPEHPETVSTRAYDRMRVQLGHQGTPRADKLCARFATSWPDLRRRCLTSADPSQELATVASATERERRVLTRAEAVFAVQRVAAHLGKDQLTVQEYEEGREALDGALSRRHRHGAQVTPLPTADTIRRKLSWPTLLGEAGLVAPKKLDPAFPRDEAIALFIEQYGFRPRQKDMLWWGRHHGVWLSNRFTEGHTTYVSKAEASFAELGRWFPPQVRRDVGCPEGWQEYEVDRARMATLRARYTRERVAGDPYTIADVRAAIRRAFDLLGPGERLTADRYRHLGARVDLPSVKTVYKVAGEHGTTFAEMVRTEAGDRAKVIWAAGPTNDEI